MRRRAPSARTSGRALAALALSACCGCGGAGGVHEALRGATGSAPETAAGRPGLVVVVVVDMLPAGALERASAHLSGGFARFLAEGRRYTECRHDHAATLTGPGHATLATGLHPSHHGIVANDWYDRESHRDVYCAEEPSTSAPASYDGSAPRGAGMLMGEGLGEALRRAVPAAKIWSVSTKDRSAILMAGRGADGAFWLSWQTGGFTSSPSALPEPPGWAEPLLGARGALAGLDGPGPPELWTYPIRDGADEDDAPWESDRYARTSPHPLADAQAGRDVVLRRIAASPWPDQATLQLAGRILSGEQLGADGATDLLLVSLSSLDAVGHLYGPTSQEYLDALIRIDGWLGAFMTLAEGAARAAGGALFALSSDHGVLPLSPASGPVRRLNPGDLRTRLEAAIGAGLGSQGRRGFIERLNGADLHLDRARLAAAGIALDAAIRETARALEAQPGIEAAYTPEELSAPAGGADPFLELFRNSYAEGRSGDVQIRYCEGCLLSRVGTGTSHGSPYPYDRRVPMMLLGPGVAPGADASLCRTVDLAPTLAGIAGVEFSSPRDGAALPLGLVDSHGPRK